MTATSALKGHPIEWNETKGEWVYADDKTPTINNERRCGYCGYGQTPEGYDMCLGLLPGVMNACCGHGNSEEAYIQFENGTIIRGFTDVSMELNQK